MLLLILCLLLALAIILVGSPSWKNPPVGVGMLISAAIVIACIWQMIAGYTPHR
jgi:hypothetical protein